jgi:hypothetical protein
MKTLLTVAKWTLAITVAALIGVACPFFGWTLAAETACAILEIEDDEDLV